MDSDTIQDLTKKQSEPFQNELDAVVVTIQKIKAAVKIEDSNKRMTEMIEAIKKLRTRQRELWGLISRIEEEAFKKALAQEYGVVGNPKLDEVYSIAYQQGHADGFSGIENSFMDLVELIK